VRLGCQGRFFESKGVKVSEEQRKQRKEVLTSWCCSLEYTKMVRSRRIDWVKYVERIVYKYVYCNRKS
jgi:hypothetical protein